MYVIEAVNMSSNDWRNARDFCLHTIKEVYGISYNSEWHSDLDAMGRAENIYLPSRRGWFIMVYDSNDNIIACAGLRALSSRPNLYEKFRILWSDPENVGALWRSYVAKDYRGGGIGKMMKERRIHKAKELGYTHLYLHASRANKTAIVFGKKYGFSVFQEEPDGTVHMKRDI